MSDISELTAESNPEDRRQYPRRRMLPALSLVDLGEDNGGLILDLSEGGLAVQAIGPLAPNAIVPLSFHLPNVPTAIEGKAEVSWVTDSKMAGIRFLETPAASQEFIRQWLTSNTEAVPAPPEFEINAAASPLIDPGQTTILGSWQAPDLPPVLHEPQAAAKPAEDLSWVDELPTLAPSEFDHLETLAPVPEAPAPDSDPETAPALPAIAALAQSLTRADGIAIALKAPGGFICRASKGSAPLVGERIETTSALYAELMRTGLPVSTSDAEREQKLDPVMRRRFDIRSLQAVPLFRRGLMVGLFQISAHRSLAFDSTHIATLQRIGDLVIAAAQKELDELSAAVQPAVPVAAVVNSFEIQPPPLQAISPAAKRHMMYEKELQERRFALWLWEIGAAPSGSYQARRPRMQNRTTQASSVSAAPPAAAATLKQPAFMPVTDDGMHTVRLFNAAEAQELAKTKPQASQPAPKPQTPSDRVRILPSDYSKLN